MLKVLACTHISAHARIHRQTDTLVCTVRSKCENMQRLKSLVFAVCRLGAAWEWECRVSLLYIDARGSSSVTSNIAYVIHRIGTHTCCSTASAWFWHSSTHAVRMLTSELRARPRLLASPEAQARSSCVSPARISGVMPTCCSTTCKRLAARRIAGTDQNAGFG